MKTVELAYNGKETMQIFIDIVEEYILDVSKNSLNYEKRNSN
jgi:hypothetical protein